MKTKIQYQYVLSLGLGADRQNAGQEGWIIGAMSEPGSYNYPVSEVMQIETHRSWVFLAGDDACKVK